MAKLFLMRWNPAISSYKLDAYHRNCEDFPDGFCIDWSIWDYNEANPGDCFVMMRVGEYRPGIVFYGSFYQLLMQMRTGLVQTRNVSTS